LPRISQPTSADGVDGPDVMFVDSAFLHESNASGLPKRSSGFKAYYSTESLFDAVPSLLTEPDREEGPYAVLGLTRSASWEAVSKSHRALVSELHPDRFVDDDEQVREAAERRVRDVNEAFAEIRRDRAGRGR
jgi:DnaJ-domain-containing protein 1